MSTNERHQTILAIYNKNPSFYPDIRIFDTVEKMSRRIHDIDGLLLQCPEKKELETERLLLLNKAQFWYPAPSIGGQMMQQLYDKVLTILQDTQRRYTEEKNEEQDELKCRHIIVLLHTMFCELSLDELNEKLSH